MTTTLVCQCLNVSLARQRTPNTSASTSAPQLHLQSLRLLSATPIGHPNIHNDPSVPNASVTLSDEWANLANATGWDTCRVEEAAASLNASFKFQGLTQVRTFKDWKITKCLLCGIDVFAVSPLQKILAVSPHLEEFKEPHPVKQGHYSSAFCMAVPDLSPDLLVNFGNYLPTQTNLDARASYENLSHELNGYLEKEQRNMQKRISAFIAKEEEQYDAIRSAAISDRKSIWMTTAALLGWGPPIQPKKVVASTEAPTPAFVTNQLNSSNQLNQPTTSSTTILPSNTSSLASTKLDEKAELNVKTTSPAPGRTVFSLDEDVAKPGPMEVKGKKTTIDIVVADSTEEISERGRSGAINSISQHEPKEDYSLYSSSLPIAVPMNSQTRKNLIQQRKAAAARAAKAADQNDKLATGAPLTDNPIDDDEEVAKSFVVPLSSNYSVGKRKE